MIIIIIDRDGDYVDGEVNDAVDNNVLFYALLFLTGAYLQLITKQRTKHSPNTHTRTHTHTHTRTHLSLIHI